VGHTVHTLHTKEVIQCDAQDVDGPCKRLARPVPQVENLRERMPVSEVELGSDHRREHDIQKGDGHAAAGDRMTHVLCVAEDDNTFLGVRPTFVFDKTFSALFSEKLHHGRQDDAHDEGEREPESRRVALGSMGQMGVCVVCAAAPGKLCTMSGIVSTVVMSSDTRMR
jgi:hypothetical protein